MEELVARLGLSRQLPSDGTMVMHELASAFLYPQVDIVFEFPVSTFVDLETVGAQQRARSMVEKLTGLRMTTR